MKRLLLLLLFVPFISFGQKDIERYKLYPALGSTNYLKLDTSTGEVWQIQLSSPYNPEKRWSIKMSDTILGDGVNGRFELYYSNKNLCVLLDAANGNAFQINQSGVNQGSTTNAQLIKEQ